MRRERLRAAHSPEGLARIYPSLHQHTRWSDHRARVATLVAIGAWFVEDVPASHRKLVDLSCGDGAVVRGIRGVAYLGDLAAGQEFTGPIEETIDQLPREAVPADLFVCCETLEHIDDPDDLLMRIRGKAHRLLISTPESEFGSGNHEHYWAWDSEAVEAMLIAAGFVPAVHTVMRLPEFGVAYQIWGCR